MIDWTLKKCARNLMYLPTESTWGICNIVAADGAPFRLRAWRRALYGDGIRSDFSRRALRSSPRDRIIAIMLTQSRFCSATITGAPFHPNNDLSNYTSYTVLPPRRWWGCVCCTRVLWTPSGEIAMAQYAQPLTFHDWLSGGRRWSKLAPVHAV